MTTEQQLEFLEYGYQMEEALDDFCKRKAGAEYLLRCILKNLKEFLTELPNEDAGRGAAFIRTIELRLKKYGFNTKF